MTNEQRERIRDKLADVIWFIYGYREACNRVGDYVDTTDTALTHSHTEALREARIFLLRGEEDEGAKP